MSDSNRILDILHAYRLKDTPSRTQEDDWSSSVLDQTGFIKRYRSSLNLTIYLNNEAIQHHKKRDTTISHNAMHLTFPSISNITGDTFFCHFSHVCKTGLK